MILYLLVHEKQYDDGSTDGKCIGFYSSMEDAKLRIATYKTIAGFMDYPDDFVIREMNVKMSIFRKQKMIKSVYFLQHEYSIGVADFVTEIGAFSSYFGALKAKRKAMRSEKFKKYPKVLRLISAKSTRTIGLKALLNIPLTKLIVKSMFSSNY